MSCLRPTLVVVLAGTLCGSALAGDSQAAAPERSLQSGRGALNQVSYSHDGLRLASAGYDKVVRVWDGQTGKELSALHGHGDMVESVAFGHDGQRVVSGASDGAIISWKLSAAATEFSVPAHKGAVWSVRFSHAGDRVVSASQDGTVKVWDAASGKCLLTMKHAGAVWNARFSPDAKQIASASFDRTVKLWDARKGSQLRILAGHTKEVLALDYSPDGRTLASGGNDRTVRIWNVATGKALKMLPQPDTVNSVAFSPDGSSLAVAVGDPVEARARTTVTILDVATWTPRATLEASCGILFNVTYRPDGAKLAASCADGSVRIWSTPGK